MPANTSTKTTSGKTLKVALHGSLSETIVPGAYYSVTTKFDRIKLSREVYDLCAGGSLDVQCPQEKGQDVVWESKDLKMPEEVPVGTFTFDIFGYTAEEDSLFCITAKANTRPIAPGPPTSHRAEVDNVAFRVQA